MTYGPVGPKSWALGTRWIKIEALFPAALLHELGEGSTTSSEGRGSDTTCGEEGDHLPVSHRSGPI
jgi:hypothetical protein